MNIQILDPRTCSSWDEVLLGTPGASFFHSSAWARVLSESYGYIPLYFTAIENGKLRALVPMMEVDSFLTGRRGVSLPFTDYCDPLLDGDVSFQELFSQMAEYGKKRKWKYIELRGGDKCLRSLEPRTSNLVPVFRSYIGHNLDISRKENEIFSSFRESTRRNIKKGEGQGVVVQISNRHAAIEEFFRLNCMTRKKHGLPPQPFHFFGKIHDHILSKELGFVALASHHGRNIAGAVFFHFGDRGIYKYGASDMNFQELRANNLVMWEAIKLFSNKGLKSFCFGRTELENKGLQQFKNGWGGEEYPLNYFKYCLRKMEFVTGRNGISSFGTKVFQRMPMPMLNLAGSVLYKHMG